MDRGDDSARPGIPATNGSRMAPPDSRLAPDNYHESVWHHLLLAGWTPRESCGSRPDLAVAHPGPWAEGQHVRTGSAIRIAGLVLALRRRCLGRSIHGGLRDWTVINARNRRKFDSSPGADTVALHSRARHHADVLRDSYAHRCHHGRHGHTTARRYRLVV